MKQKFKRAVIFINGDETDLNYVQAYIDQQTLVVGCDGGTDKIYDLGLTPDAVIGDFDSIRTQPSEIQNLSPDPSGQTKKIDDIVYVKYPQDKDYLDAELAIDYVVNQDIKDIVLVNTNGEELDHVLGIVMILIKRKYRAMNIKIARKNQKIYIARDEFMITGEIGDKVSLVPLYGDVKVESSSGMKYDPARYRMSLEHNIGISNELVSKKATIKISEGCFLVIHHGDGIAYK